MPISAWYPHFLQVFPQLLEDSSWTLLSAWPLLHWDALRELHFHHQGYRSPMTWTELLSSAVGYQASSLKNSTKLPAEMQNQIFQNLEMKSESNLLRNPRGMISYNEPRQGPCKSIQIFWLVFAHTWGQIFWVSNFPSMVTRHLHTACLELPLSPSRHQRQPSKGKSNIMSIKSLSPKIYLYST